MRLSKLGSSWELGVSPRARMASASVSAAEGRTTVRQAVATTITVASADRIRNLTTLIPRIVPRQVWFQRYMPRTSPRQVRSAAGI
jgi:hypothetical protein